MSEHHVLAFLDRKLMTCRPAHTQSVCFFCGRHAFCIRALKLCFYADVSLRDLPLLYDIIRAFRLHCSINICLRFLTAGWYE